MPTDVIMPQMGESIFEGTITKWLKKPGDTVQRDEPLFEISTDKVDAEIPSPAAGVLKEIKVAEGATVQVNTVVGVIDAAGGASASAPAATAQAVQAKPEPAQKAATMIDTSSPGDAVRETPTPAPPQKPSQPAAPAPNGGGREERIRSSPLVRRIAKDNNVDLAQLPPGSGSGGRINKDDILSFIAQQGKGGAAPARTAPQTATSQAPVAPGAGITVPGDLVPMSKMRAIIAQRMVESKHTSAHVHTVFKVDMTKVVRIRERERNKFEQRNGVKLTYMPFISRALI